jgi:hypothetical protein
MRVPIASIGGGHDLFSTRLAANSTAHSQGCENERARTGALVPHGIVPTAAAGEATATVVPADDHRDRHALSGATSQPRHRGPEFVVVALELHDLVSADQQTFRI